MDTRIQKIEQDTEKEIYNTIDILNKILWDGSVLKPTILDWLSNFKEDDEKKQALYLLSRCMYFNLSSTRYLLKALYRDKYRTPIIQEIRILNDGTIDERVIETAFNERLKKTRFLGVGNPSESGGHLLYYFRQENKIPKDLFVTIDDLLNDCEGIEHVVFVDDLCGSGSQVKYDQKIYNCISTLRKSDSCPKFSYLMLIGTTKGINRVRDLVDKNDRKLFDEVEAEMELNDSYKCFGEQSRYFDNVEQKNYTMNMCLKYGMELINIIADRDFPQKPLTGENRNKYIRSCALGFGDCQLLLSLQHNTPNNTLPIFWFDEPGYDWKPIFKRYNKIY